MYYIIDLESNKILSFAPEGPIEGLHSTNDMIWVEDAYHCCYLDSYYDAEVIIKLLSQYGGFNKKKLEIRKLIHD